MVWEQRRYPLREQWVVVPAHRNNRPWVGETVEDERAAVPGHVADCPHCPGNTRVSGACNAEYASGRTGETSSCEWDRLSVLGSYPM